MDRFRLPVRVTREARLVLHTAVICGALALASQSDAMAAQPIPGGRYEGKSVALTISDDGRALSPQSETALGVGYGLLRSAVRYPRCGGTKLARWVLADASGAAPLTIDASGRFSLVQRTTDVNEVTRQLALSGHFLTRTRARGTLRVRTTELGARPCDTGRLAFKISYTGERHLLHGDCAVPGTKTLAQNADARVYLERFHDRPYTTSSWDYGDIDAVAVACQFTARERRIIAVAAAEGEEPVSTGQWTISGDYVADSEDVCCETGYFDVSVYRISDASLANTVQCLDGAGPCDKWYITASGTLCWTDKPSDPKPPVTRVAIQRAGPKEDPVVLDTGVVLDSLRVDGTTLSWTRKDGEQRSAQVP